MQMTIAALATLAGLGALTACWVVVLRMNSRAGVPYRAEHRRSVLHYLMDVMEIPRDDKELRRTPAWRLAARRKRKRPRRSR